MGAYTQGVGVRRWYRGKVTLAAVLTLCGCGKTAASRHPDVETPLPSDAGNAGMSAAVATGGAGQGGMLLDGGGGGDAALAGTSTAGAPVGGSPDDGPCSGTALEIRNLKLSDTDGDGLYERDEHIHLIAELASTGAPTTAKVSVVADDPALELVGGLASDVFDLVPGKPAPLSVDFFIPPQVERGSEYAFQVTLTSTSTSTSTEQPECFAPVTRELLLTVMDNSDDVRRCEMVRQLELSNPHVVDSSGDGQVQPGEDFELKVTLTNPGPLDEVGYPGMTVVSSDPGVGVRDGLAGWYFAIGVGSINLSWGMRAQASVTSGTLTRLTLTPAIHGLRCRNVKKTLEYSLPIK